MAYTPHPIDTSKATIPAGISALAEALARNAHDVWGKQRLADGWTWGPQRDDARKLHPCLVPYEQLSETEKQYDRNAALETLKAIQNLGYVIQDAAHAPATAKTADHEIKKDESRGDDSSGEGLFRLLRLWRRHSHRSWSKSPRRYRVLAERLIGIGEPLLAYDALSEAIGVWPGDLRLRQLLALALARSGATERANVLLRQMADEGNQDEETLGLLVRTYKDLGERAATLTDRERHWTQAYQTYRQAYRNSGGYWSGINAAAMAVCLNLRDEASAIACEVRDKCAALKQQTRANDYWLTATLGEACLILGEMEESEKYYREAAGMGRSMIGSLASTRRNALMLLHHLGIDASRLSKILAVPRVVVFASPMGERIGEGVAADSYNVFSDLLADRLKALDVGCGYSPATNHWDILFHEAIGKAKGESHAVLSNNQTIAADSGDQQGWGSRRERAVHKAVEVVFASPHTVTWASTCFSYTDLLMQGMATIRARQLATEVVLINLHRSDGLKQDRTVAMIRNSQALGHKVESIVLDGLLSEQLPIVLGEPVETRSAPPAPIMAMLFADVVGYSKLAEHEIPPFFQHFLGLVASIISCSPHHILLKNTWGDGLYMVFNTVGAAGEFALDLCDRVANTNWTSLGLGKQLSLRIGLHAGPVYVCNNPVTGFPDYTGTHVSWAARIEPIAPAGEVYASQAFASLAGMASNLPFVCEYVGRIPLAKSYGAFPMYHIRRRGLV